jgi:drug/metabolite transporter (DMT)-like permease
VEPRSRALAALLVAAVSISFAAPLARLAGVDGVSAAWWRLLVGSSLTLAAAALWGRLPAPGLVLRLSPAGFLLGAHFSLWFESLRYSSVASSTGIVVSYPVMAAAVEAARGEASGRLLAGVALGFGGVAVLSTPWAGASPAGSVLSLAAAAAAAAYFLYGRRARVRGVGTLEYTAAVYSASLAAVTLYALAAGVDPLGVPGRSLPYLVLLGVVPMLGGHTAMNYALGYLPASTVSSVALAEPYGASLLAWLLLGEEPGPAVAPGLLLSAAGAWLVLRESL